jgi:hypothetical protein
LDNFIPKLESVLPKNFWLTEISIPELFWTNQRKVGEIITDPDEFAKSHDNGVRFVRIPYWLGFVDGDDVKAFEVAQDEPHHPLFVSSDASM